MISDQERNRIELMAAVTARLGDVNWAHVALAHPSIEVLAKKLVAIPPTVCIQQPPVGACFFIAGLTVWRGMNPQAVHQSRKMGRILGSTYEGQIVYPGVQFSESGRPLPEMRELLRSTSGDLSSADQVAAWLDKMDQDSEMTPREALLAAQTRAAAPGRRLPKFSDLTVIRPEDLPLYRTSA